MNVSKSLEPYIQEAEEFDLRPFLGEELYIDLVEDFDASPSLVKYSALYNGSIYTYNNHKYKHEGIVAALAYFTYARYVSNANNHSTPTGIMVKKNDFSEQASEKTIARLIEQARSGATTYQERVRQFLNLNRADYPLWLYSRTNKTSNLRISGVGGNSTDYLRDNRRNINSSIWCPACRTYGCGCYLNY